MNKWGAFYLFIADFFATRIIGGTKRASGPFVIKWRHLIITMNQKSRLPIWSVPPKLFFLTEYSDCTLGFQQRGTIEETLYSMSKNHGMSRHSKRN